MLEAPCATSLSASHRPCQPLVWRAFPRPSTPPSFEVQELAGKGQFHTTDNGIVLLVCKPTPSLLPGSQGPVARLLIDQRACSHLRIATHAPLSQEGFPSHDSLPSRHHAYAAAARTTLLLIVYWYGCLHPVLASQLPEPPSTGNLSADSPVTVPMSLPGRLGISVSVDYSGPFSTMSRVTPTSRSSLTV